MIVLTQVTALIVLITICLVTSFVCIMFLWGYYEKWINLNGMKETQEKLKDLYMDFRYTGVSDDVKWVLLYLHKHFPNFSYGDMSDEYDRRPSVSDKKNLTKVITAIKSRRDLLRDGVIRHAENGTLTNADYLKLEAVDEFDLILKWIEGNE